MSATNHTTTIGLSQYISTDKPTYLTDYNNDMLAIDNAIASDRDGITSAQNKANTADGKADANKTSIDTINEQINGNPTATPPTSGIAGKVTTLENSLNTLSSLVGNGHPTTSDQTVIGAINNLEDTIAPSEDSAELGADYDTGEVFMRGGKLYEALVDLTSGTAFSTLTLNTEYKVADRLVKQIVDATAAIADKIGAYKTGSKVTVSVTADGIKAYTALLDELFALLNTSISGLNTNDLVTNLELHIPALGDMFALETKIAGGASHNHYHFNSMFPVSNTIYLRAIDMRASNTNVVQSILDSATLATTNEGSVVPSEGAIIKVDYIPLISLGE